MSVWAKNELNLQDHLLSSLPGKIISFFQTILPKSTSNAACFISISNATHAKYKLSQAPLLNDEKSL